MASTSFSMDWRMILPQGKYLKASLLGSTMVVTKHITLRKMAMATVIRMPPKANMARRR